MKRLGLLRHAKSGWDDGALRDFDRPLNPRGRRAARAIGRWLRAEGVEYDLALASPAKRVAETLDELETEGFAPETQCDERLYLASPVTLLEAIRAAAPGLGSLLIVGHNPGLESLALSLARDDGRMRRRELAEKFPTATLAELVFAVDDWSEVAAGCGELKRFVRPRDLDPGLGPEE